MPAELGNWYGTCRMHVGMQDYIPMSSWDQEVTSGIICVIDYTCCYSIIGRYKDQSPRNPLSTMHTWMRTTRTFIEIPIQRFIHLTKFIWNWEGIYWRRNKLKNKVFQWIKERKRIHECWHQIEQNGNSKWCQEKERERIFLLTPKRTRKNFQKVSRKRNKKNPWK